MQTGLFPTLLHRMKKHLQLFTGIVVGLAFGFAAACILCSDDSAPTAVVDSVIPVANGVTLVVPGSQSSVSPPPTAAVGVARHDVENPPASGEMVPPPCDAVQMMSRLRHVAAGGVGGIEMSRVNWDVVAPFLAEKDAHGVFDLALNLPSGRAARMLCVEALKVLATGDAQGAWQQAGRVGPGTMQRDARKAVLETWASADPQSAAQAAISLPQDAPDLFAQVAGLWARCDGLRVLREPLETKVRE